MRQMINCLLKFHFTLAIFHIVSFYLLELGENICLPLINVSVCRNIYVVTLQPLIEDFLLEIVNLTGVLSADGGANTNENDKGNPVKIFLIFFLIFKIFSQLTYSFLTLSAFAINSLYYRIEN